MKIDNNDDNVVIYLFNRHIDIDNISDLNNKIKDIFIKLMKRGNYDFFGYNQVNVYHNRWYGTILEVNKIYNNDLNYQTIDLKVIVYKDVLMYLEFEEYCFNNKPRNLIYSNGKYYLEINDKLDINNYIEFGKIKYKKLINEID